MGKEAAPLRFVRPPAGLIEELLQAIKSIITANYIYYGKIKTSTTIKPPRLWFPAAVSQLSAHTESYRCCI